MESENKREGRQGGAVWEERVRSGHPVGGVAQSGGLYSTGPASMQESTGGAKAGEFFLFKKTVSEFGQVLLFGQRLIWNIDMQMLQVLSYMVVASCFFLN